MKKSSRKKLKKKLKKRKMMNKNNNINKIKPLIQFWIRGKNNVYIVTGDNQLGLN